MTRIRQIIADYWVGTATLVFGLLCVYVLWRAL